MSGDRNKDVVRAMQTVGTVLNAHASTSAASRALSVLTLLDVGETAEMVGALRAAETEVRIAERALERAVDALKPIADAALKSGLLREAER